MLDELLNTFGKSNLNSILNTMIDKSQFFSYINRKDGTGEQHYWIKSLHKFKVLTNFAIVVLQTEIYTRTTPQIYCKCRECVLKLKMFAHTYHISETRHPLTLHGK